MIFRAPEPDVVIPDVALTPFLFERTASLGDKPAFIDGPTGRTLTYRGWAEGVRRAAAGLSARGFRKGDVLAIYSPNLPEYAIAFHAVSLLGGVVTTINPVYTAAELQHRRSAASPTTVSQTASISMIRVAATLSCGVWLCSVPPHVSRMANHSSWDLPVASRIFSSDTP